METVELEKIIRKRNGRMTRVRKAMLEVFRSAKNPMTASDIVEALAKRRISADRTTIYRELAFLIEAEIIREVRITGRGRSFEFSGGHRHHLVCLRCDQVKSISFEDHLAGEEARLLQDERFRVLDHSLEFYGYCDTCAADAK